ncbi:hypothetical protein BT96DRAFT_262001 [Gymnopus androsaceus JB14]|uniref:Uncharacterized protein n=1 Tax=Gymnopus androsaceus JB14 TaxID=1447944 RepID=A0A6A4H6D3_9AGAR|nr:hypothetical protein BT96DRAFT_262001 [Gymnopus androsaceus JB14]
MKVVKLTLILGLLQCKPLRLLPIAGNIIIFPLTFGMKAIEVLAYDSWLTSVKVIDIVSSWSSMETIEVLAHYSSSLMISPIIVEGQQFLLEF